MKTWPRRTCAESEKGEGKLSQNENIGQGEPVQNEKRGIGSFHKMKTWPRRTGEE